MRKQILWVCVVLFALSHQLMDAYLYHAVVLRKWLAAQERYHYFVGFGDYHLKQHVVNNAQRELIEHLFAQQDVHSCRILTEDLSVPNLYGDFTCKGYYVNSRGGFLGGITDRLASCGLDVANLEYRYARVCALGPVFNQQPSKLKNMCSVHAITTRDIVQEVERVCRQLAAYDDGPMLNNWYHACIDQVDKKLQAYGLIERNLSMAEYIKIEHINVQQLKQMLIFDCTLLDAQIVHETVRSTDKDTVYALAGGSHIERASNMLQRVGYRPYMQIKPVYMGHDLEYCLEVQSDHKQTRMPEPITCDQLSCYF